MQNLGIDKKKIFKGRLKELGLRMESVTNLMVWGRGAGGSGMRSSKHGEESNEDDLTTI